MDWWKKLEDMIKELRIYAVHKGCFGDSGQIDKRFRLKKNATKYIKSHKGFKLNKTFRDESLYENEEVAEWFRIDDEYITISD